jgi:hypothetical protein
MRTTGAEPGVAAAAINAVRPLFETLFTSAPWSSRSRTFEFAQISGVEGSVEFVAIGFRGLKSESGRQRGEAEEQRFWDM